MTVRHGVVVALAGLACPTPVLAFDLYGGVGVEAQGLLLWHDASAFSPLLGNPTSILNYPILVSPSANFGVRGDTQSVRLDVNLSLRGFGRGDFEDVDYGNGQTVLSDTISQGRGDPGAMLVARMEPLQPLAAGETWSLSPYMEVRAEYQGFSAWGLSCASVCAAPTYPDSDEVIRHDLMTAQLGAGLQADFRLDDDAALRVQLTGAYGGTNVDDHHLLRPDLGATPNLLYRFQTLSLNLASTYTHAIGDGLSATASAFAGYDRGWGAVTFGPSTAAPLTFPAGLQRVRLGVGLGLEGQF